MKRSPMVSLIMVVKDGMPHLPEAIASVRRQTSRDFELIVQDAVSTDGSIDVLRRELGGRAWAKMVSEPDAGVGDAVNRALDRCNGTLVGFIDADNLLEPDAVARVTEHFAIHADCAVAYSASRMIDEEGRELSVFRAGPFDLTKLLLFELVPPFATAFFHREKCGNSLRSDVSLRTCADFDIWLRLSHLSIHEIDHVLAATRICAISRSREASLYERFCRDKSTVLERFFSQQPDVPVIRSLKKQAYVGLYLWAAESVLELDGPGERFTQWCDKAAAIDPAHRRLNWLRRKGQQLQMQAPGAETASK